MYAHVHMQSLCMVWDYKNRFIYVGYQVDNLLCFMKCRWPIDPMRDLDGIITCNMVACISIPMYAHVHILQNIGDICSEGRLIIITENYWPITLNANEVPKIN